MPSSDPQFSTVALPVIFIELTSINASDSDSDSDLFPTTYILINRDNRTVNNTKLWGKLHSQLTVFLQHLNMCIYLTKSIGHRYHMVWLGKERDIYLYI